MSTEVGLDQCLKAKYKYTPSLPVEIWDLVLSYLDNYFDRRNAKLVCSTFYNLIQYRYFISLDMDKCSRDYTKLPYLRVIYTSDRVINQIDTLANGYIIVSTGEKTGFFDRGAYNFVIDSKMTKNTIAEKVFAFNKQSQSGKTFIKALKNGNIMSVDHDLYGHTSLAICSGKTGNIIKQFSINDVGVASKIVELDVSDNEEQVSIIAERDYVGYREIQTVLFDIKVGEVLKNKNERSFHPASNERKSNDINLPNGHQCYFIHGLTSLFFVNRKNWHNQKRLMQVKNDRPQNSFEKTYEYENEHIKLLPNGNMIASYVEKICKDEEEGCLSLTKKSYICKLTFPPIEHTKKEENQIEDHQVISFKKA